jgi:hypothetical protein
MGEKFVQNRRVSPAACGDGAVPVERNASPLCYQIVDECIAGPGVAGNRFLARQDKAHISDAANIDECNRSGETRRKLRARNGI